MDVTTLMSHIDGVRKEIVVLDSQMFPGKSDAALGRAYRYLTWARDAVQSVDTGSETVPSTCAST